MLSMSKGKSLNYKTCAKKRFKQFQEDDYNLQDKQSSKKPKEVNQKTVIKTIESNPSFTTRMLANKHPCFYYFIIQTLNEDSFCV